MISYQVLKRKAVSRRVFELSCTKMDKQTNKQTDNEFYLRRSTGLANRSANLAGAVNIPRFRITVVQCKRVYSDSFDICTFRSIFLPILTLNTNGTCLSNSLKIFVFMLAG